MGRVSSPAAERAQQIADEVLFPAAMAVEEAGQVPASHLDLLASAGFYGLAGPPGSGWLAVDPKPACQIIEVLASGCLSTTFVWLQHHGAVRAVLAAGPAVRGEWLEPLCTGARRGGIALGGAMPGPPLLRARRVPGGYVLDGMSPWVTGWGMIDVLLAAARDSHDNVVTALIPARAGPTLAAEPVRMVAVMASSTVQLRVHDHFVADGSVTSVAPHRDWLARDAMGLRINGSLALGLIARCCRLLGPSPLDGELAARRAALDGAQPPAMPAARAAASALAIRAASALVTAAGSRAILAGQHPQRLAREALFLLVFGSRPAIRESLADHLTAALSW